MDEGFPAGLFRMGGSPAAIQTSTARYQRFGQAATQAADRIAGMDTGQFIGPEADQFRQKLNSDLPPHLRVTGQAFTEVSSALGAFASQLAELQAQMRPLADHAPGAWQRLQAAKAAFADAHAADQAHNAAPPPANVDPSHPPASAPQTAAPASPGAQAQLNAAQQEWDALVHKATMLRGEMTAASRRCSQAIEAAKAMRFQKPPGTFDLAGQARDFLREHQDTLKSVANTLKSASAVVSALGLALQAIPGVGTAVGSALMATGAGMAAAGIGIDLATYSATGGKLTNLLVGSGAGISLISAEAHAAWAFTKRNAKQIGRAGDYLGDVGAALSIATVVLAPVPVVGEIVGASAIGVNAAALIAHTLAKAGGADVSWSKIPSDALGIIPGGGAVAGNASALKAAPRMIKAVSRGGKGLENAGRAMEDSNKVITRLSKAQMDKWSTTFDKVSRYVGRDARHASKLSSNIGGAGIGIAQHVGIDFGSNRAENAGKYAFHQVEQGRAPSAGAVFNTVLYGKAT